MVTPEMLLWLAGKMGMPNPVAELGECCYVEAQGVWRVFNPAADDAQFGRLVVWAAMLELSMEFDTTVVTAWSEIEYRRIAVDYEPTPDSIRAAAVVAICRALGWEDGHA